MKYFLTVIALLCITSFTYAQKSEKFAIKTVVIDPGHGGRDAGAVFGKLYEKDIVLDVALRLGKKMKKEFPHINVVYTRDTDEFIPLDQRGAIANKAKGDLFISIHVNATKDKVTKATGTETFTMGIHNSAANLEVAKKENSVIMFEDDYQKKYQGFDPNDDESYIVFGLCQYSFNVTSILFADILEKSFVANKNGFKSRGVKQLGLLVLRETSMPSVLTELGFINNSEDRKILSSDSGKDTIAESLLSAFKNYKDKVEVESTYITSDNPKAKDATPVTTKQIELKPYTSRSVAYAIQVTTSPSKIAITKAKFGSRSANIFEIRDGKRYKYFVGVLNSYDDALSLQSILRKERFKDCYVVGIKNGKVVANSEINKKR